MQPRRIYMDNAATSFPKPSTVHEAMRHFATNLGASAGRGSYAEARETGRLVDLCRQRINTLIHGDPRSCKQIIFTLNATDALNLAIRGVLTACAPGNPRPRNSHKHVITTWLDHNSVLRPFNELSRRGDIKQTRVPCDPETGLVDPDDIRTAIRPNTALIAVVHGSNVTGTIQPIGAIGRMARERDIPFLVDAAQTLGHMPVDVIEDHIDLLAFPGHKGLLGPLGTGGLYIRPGMEKRMCSVREGGTGSRSEQDTQPDFLPDRFEPGSQNAIGIIGLSEGVQWILDQGIDTLWQREQDLIRIMIETLSQPLACPGLTWHGPRGIRDRCGVFSIRVEGFDNPELVSRVLEEKFGILTRSGIHCAPLTHKTLGTHSLAGSTRLSLGPFLTVRDVQFVCDALGRICQEQTVGVV